MSVYDQRCIWRERLNLDFFMNTLQHRPKQQLWRPDSQRSLLVPNKADTSGQIWVRALLHPTPWLWNVSLKSFHSSFSRYTFLQADLPTSQLLDDVLLSWAKHALAHHWQVVSGLSHVFLLICSLSDSMRLAIIAPCACACPHC